MKGYIVVIVVLTILACSALASKPKSKPKSCKKSDKNCKACFSACYTWSNTRTTTLLSSSIIHGAIISHIHKADSSRKIPAVPATKCSGSGAKCADKCKEVKVAYKSTSLKVAATLTIHSCGKCNSTEKNIPWEKTGTAHEALTSITGVEMRVTFKCGKGCSVSANLGVIFFGVLLTLKAAF
ncbi:uncharacterized protein LOC135493484 [Lineus longissimus]|uniref:uncharacterized protein LOC135493484 n=1 Tax=Lineus longissimus TaxID=88925 RepID=UPI002B4E9315